jgi:TRAP-type C4-dicarboxylate transport system permease small subunit
MTVGGERPEGEQVPSGALPGELDEATHAEQTLEQVEGEELLPERSSIRRLLRAIGFAEQAIGTSLIVVILVLVLIQVGQRYIHTFGGWPWTGEIARLSLVWCTFILAGYLMAQDRHITIKAIDFVVQGRALEAVKLAAHVIVLVTCLSMGYATYRLIADDIGQRTPAAGWPLVWVYVLPLIGFLLTALRAGLAIGILDIPRLRHGSPTR